MNNTFHTPRRARRAFSARTTLAAAIVALACGGCAFDQPLAGLGNIFGSPAEAKTAATGKHIEGDITSLKALEFLYGKAVVLSKAEAEKAFDGTKPGLCLEFGSYQPADEYDYASGRAAAMCKVFEGRYMEQGVEKYMLVTEQRYTYEKGDDRGDNSCRACITHVNIAVFHRNDGKWELVAKKDMEGGSVGRWDGWGKLMRVGSDKYGVSSIHAAGGWNICVIMPYEGNIDSFYVNPESVNPEEVGWGYIDGRGWYIDDVELSFDEKSGGEYYDAILSYKYTASEGAKAVKKNKRFRFTNGKYQEVKSAKKSTTKKRK